MIKHLAFVMDGNRRWAKRQGLFPWQGHREGVESLKRVVDFCIAQQIPYASFYTFSLENFKRPEDEKGVLFDLIIEQAYASIPLFVEKNAKVRFIGDRSQFPEQVKKSCEVIETQTAHLTGINVNFLFCYGARQEIVASIRSIVQAVQDGRVAKDHITQEVVTQHLWTNGIPEPELIIRTGGVRRLSNFLLYQAAYSEMYFLDCLWPEITQTHLHDALQAYAETQRNFGS